MQNIEITSTPGSLLILRVSIISKIIAPVVIQPGLENWVRKDGRIFPVQFEVEPAYSFLQTGGEAKVTFTVRIPIDVAPGDKLFGVLCIPSAEIYNYPIHLIITSPDSVNENVTDAIARIEVPPTSSKEENPNQNYLISKSTIKLLAGFASLEVIPSKWIVSELILRCCSVGYDYAITKAGTKRLRKLSKTRFYKNGVLVFRGTQFVEWIKLGLSISSGINSIAGGKKGSSLILQNWEEWLFNLINQDIESPDFEHRQIDFPTPVDHQRILTVMEVDPEKWFAYLIMGLSRISARIDSILVQLIAEIKDTSIEENGRDIDAPDDILGEEGSIQR